MWKCHCDSGKKFSGLINQYKIDFQKKMAFRCSEYHHKSPKITDSTCQPNTNFKFSELLNQISYKHVQCYVSNSMHLILFFFQHGIDSDQPIKYSHVDIAGSSGPFPGVPTGAPISALAAKYILGL